MEGVSPQRTDKPADPAERARRAGTAPPAGGTDRPELALALGRAGHRDRRHPARRRHDQDHERQDDLVHQVHAGGDVQAGVDGQDLQLHRRDHREPQGRDQLRGPGPQPVAAQRRHRRCATTVSRSASPPRRRTCFTDLLPYIFIIAIGAAFIYFIGRQTRGQMSGIMSIGRSKAKTFSSDRPVDHLRRRGRLHRGQAGDQRGGRLPQDPGPLQGDRGQDPQGRPPGRPARNRQDADRPRRRRRGRRALHVGERLGLHGDVRGRRGQPGARPVPDRPQAGPGHRLRRRDRLHRPQARCRARRRPRRARADAQPDALGDGRLRHRRGRGHDRGHQPARHPGPGPAAAGPLRPPDRRAAARPRGAAPHPRRCTARASGWPTTSTSAWWRGARRA